MDGQDDEDLMPFSSTIDPHALHHNIIKILLATDNHIGYLERDPVRGLDSINTFREILQLAVKHDVDLVLLGGDLFHENRPSRDTLYQVMALLREYTLGDRPIQVELLSDPKEGSATTYSFPAVNYEDPNFNVGLPVFSIHGNHDDPQGAGAEGALGALDVLSVAGLINYMGKIDLPYSDANAQQEGIAIKPVLLRKGMTKLALYGIGNVKDQRLHFELRSNRVRMFMPRDKDDWFNILLVHQNRVPRGPQNSVPEGMFDDSIDLVVWGHEHDCRIIPEPVAGKKYRITQPGSSVATSLADGESLDKHVALIKIHGKEYNLKAIPLRTVRPFVLEEIVLTEVAKEKRFDIDDHIEIEKYLRSKVNALIAKADEAWDERNAAAVQQGEIELPRMLPLVRLKVDTTGVSAISNPIRFGQEFQGKIANPRDVLIFHRAKRSTKSKVVVDQPELSIDDPDLSISEKLSKLRVQTLVKEFLGAQELQLLGEPAMSAAIETFVDKDDTHAIENHVTQSLEKMMKNVQGTETIDEDELDDMVAKAREEHEKEFAANNHQTQKSKSKGKAVADGSGGDRADSMELEMNVDGSDFHEPVAKKKATTKGKRVAQVSESEDFEEPTSKRATARGRKPAAATTKKKAPAKGRTKKAVVESEVDQDDDDDDDDEIVEAPKRKSRTAVLSPPTSKKAPAKKTTASGSKSGTLSFAPSGRSTRTAASRAKTKINEVVDLSD